VIAPPRMIAALVAVCALRPCMAAGQQRPDPAAQAYRTGKYDEAIARYGVAAARGEDAGARGLGAALAAVGRYDEAVRRVRGYLKAHPAAPLWEALGEVLLDRGRLKEAEDAFTRALATGRPDSVVAALRLAELAERHGDRVGARRRYHSFITLYNNVPGLSSRELAAVARAVWHLGAEDPQLFKDALRAYDEAVAADSANLDARVEEGNLFLEKYNGTDAQATFEDVLRINPKSAGGMVGLARAVHFAGEPGARARIRQCLEVNPRYVPALLFLARLDLEGEAYDSAAADVGRALAVDSTLQEALSLLAATRFLSGDSTEFAAIARRLLTEDQHYAPFYTTLAEVAARGRRYAEAAGFARQAIALDSSDWHGYSLLGMNELRLGSVSEARRHLETAFRGDPYDVWTKNTLDLLGNLDRYRTIATERFRLVMAPGEADVMALYAGPLAEQAFDSLTAHYGYHPPTPIRVEIFDRHADFSVRTVGLVGFDALGVSFGPVVAMDSPSARDPGHFHWGSTLWHEISHSFHMGLSHSRVPRWFTEGLAVFEEHRARPGWGDGVTPEFLVAFLEGRLVPVSRLNRGFMRPQYPEQLIFSYYEASLVCDAIAAEHGRGALRALLLQFGQGRTTEQAFQAVLGTTPEELDARFNMYVRRRFAGPLAALKPWAESHTKSAKTDPAELLARARANPDDFEAQFIAGHALFERGELDAAEPLLAQARHLFPQYAGLDSPAWYLAQIFQRRGAKARAVAELDSLTTENQGHYRALLLLAALRDSLGETREAARALQRALYVYPLDAAVHRRLAELASELKEWPTVIRERRAIVALAPVDRAEALYQLALAYFRAGALEQAHGNVLRALEQAPEFEQAQELLLEIRAAMKKKGDGADASGRERASH
jgi:tetratricopeptide (TPR) repeat protein